MDTNISVTKVEGFVDEHADPVRVAREQQQQRELIQEAKDKMDAGLEELGGKRRENSWRLPDGITVTPIDSEGVIVEVAVDTDTELVKATVPAQEAPAAVERMTNLAKAGAGKITLNGKEVDLSLAAKLELFNLVGGDPATMELQFDSPIEVKNGALLVLPYGV